MPHKKTIKIILQESNSEQLLFLMPTRKEKQGWKKAKPGNVHHKESMHHLEKYIPRMI